MNTIRDNPVVKGQGNDSGNRAYWLPEKFCASCGESTRKASLHLDCRRVKGKLVVAP